MKRWPVPRPGVRAAIQTTFLAIFLAGIIAAARGGMLPITVAWFLRADPLLGWISGIAAREFLPAVLWGSLLLAATACLGRFFCGWICPLGTCLDMAGVATRTRRPRRLPTQIKYWLLAALVVAAVAGVNFSGWLDPLVITARAVFSLAAPSFRGVQAAIAWSWLLVAGGLILLAPRFWCKSLCPLGAMLALAGWPVGLRRRVGPSCTQCGLCDPVCPMGQTWDRYSASECLVCRRCASVCRFDAISYRLGAEPSQREPAHAGNARKSVQAGGAEGGRRAVLLGIGGLAVTVLAGGWLRRTGAPPELRPPGVADEARLRARCVGCGACLAACPTGGLMPQLTFARLDVPFAPRLVPREGPCLPSCTLCASVCPTGAIPRPDPRHRDPPRMGRAVIDPKRCLPWARRERCVICLDACPEMWGAISLEPADGGVFVPQVDESKCTGCGACEHRCPVEPGGAIRVEPCAAGVNRSEL